MARDEQWVAGERARLMTWDRKKLIGWVQAMVDRAQA